MADGLLNFASVKLTSNNPIFNNLIVYMTKLTSSAVFAALAFASAPAIMAETVHISTPATSLVIEATNGAPAKFLYYGAALHASDVENLSSSGAADINAYPVYGLHPEGEAALSAIHTDGNMTLDMEVTGVSTANEPNGAIVTSIAMKDKVYPFNIVLKYRTFPGENIIETWSEVSHSERGTVTLNRFMSGYLPLRHSNVHVSQLYGTWADEAQVEEAPLPHGVKIIKNKDGLRNSHTAHGEVMISLDGPANEHSGRVIGAAIEYSGNYKLMFDTDPGNYHHFFAGINEENSAYHLAKGETFVTPPLALTYSEEGLGGVSRAFHRWGRNYRLAHGDTPRKILLNSWEGVYFDINEEGMHQMMSDIADMGGELFVMDDGWFATKYQRNTDNAALGDWTVDTKKLPNGIQGLIDAAKERGIKFGIWIEPEMTNTVSEFYEKHPEYIITSAGRKPITGRGGTQLVLDLANPKVQDVVFNIVDTLLTNYPEIDYIKWDANAPIMEHGSQYLTADKQSHLYIEYHRGFVKTVERIRAKYPNITIQACASGGGRANWGVLPYFDEFWVSDNNDAVQRVFMQYGTSYFFPSIAMAQHISASPSHQTNRVLPLKFRTDVAMSGRLGMEIQPKNMTDAEKEQTRKAIEAYKGIRSTVQFGDQYRLLSPYAGKGVASLMFVEPSKEKAVFFWYKINQLCGEQLPIIRLAGLDPERKYKITELNRADFSPLPFEGKSFTGSYLMSNGLDIPVVDPNNWTRVNDYQSRVLVLEAE